MAASYFFYAWWDYRFLGLIIFSSLVDYTLSLKIVHSTRKQTRKAWLGISLISNLGLLAYFKYFNFFLESWTEAWSKMGFEMNYSSWSIILPVGISFYTFQTLSYTIEVYKERMQPTRNFFNFSLYVAFFPQLIAGPIERAQNLLPQLNKKRNFNFYQAREGVHLIIWGLFKKVVIADSCAIYVNEIFDNHEDMNSLSLILGAVYFAFQIYGDFSGYSDMAIGTARLFGIKLMQNFNYPYFSRNIGEFWRRWHISLSTWFRDYLYIPLGGSRNNRIHTIRNVFVIFLVSGLWHGANWAFIVWGGLHALFFIPILLVSRNRKYLDTAGKNRYLPGIKETFQMLYTFGIVSIGWIFFRADSFSTAINYLKRIIAFENFKLQYLSIERYNIELILLIFLFVVLEWFQRNEEHPFIGRFKFLKIILILLLILSLGVFSDYQEFIYFQF
ncbi:MBOAT family O-acyltransferase [Salegentibacter tibetensis]|uniref:MBOAT family O-acyltransferase n=1 Tax=Salegentibacter tibetensis TaxID=2873600 RepID=UPI00293D878B|nr:MBOAT family O-acyltransferase [Salegentibacter tibetensis]